MGAYGAVIAIASIVLPGVLLVILLVPLSAGAALIAGYGLMAGLLLIPLLMRLVDLVGLPMDFSTVLTTTAVFATLLTLLLVPGWRRKRGDVGTFQEVAIPDSMLTWPKLLVWTLLFFIAVRFLTLGVEVVLRPVYPFDATMHWATKARVWYEASSIVPFVENSRWLALGGEGVYTDHHPDYPVTLPLLQVWMSSATGAWNESLINLPWLLCFLALGLAFYGQASVAGVNPVHSVVFTYLLLSMPLIDTHVALAGYADIFLAAAYCLALMAFHNWTIQRQAWQGRLALLAALACPLIKNEGFYWMLTFIPALAVVLLPARRALSVMAVLALGLMMAVLFFPPDLAVAGHSLDRLNIGFRSGALAGIRDIFFVHDNWHLFAYMLVFLLAAAVWKIKADMYRFAGILTATGSALALFLFLFLFTVYSGGAIRFTAVGRIALQLVPGLLFLSLMLFSELTRQRPAAMPLTEARNDQIR